MSVFSWQYLVFWVFGFLPWVLIAIAGVVGYVHTRKMPVLLQAVGSGIIACFLVLIMLSYLLLMQSGGSARWVYAIEQWVTLAVQGAGYGFFVVGYCMEKFRKPAPGSGMGTPISGIR